ncbi:MAG: HAMP domain-containing sensor histidine kinase [Candidatus Margulisiibacteriota bacterium]
MKTFFPDSIDERKKIFALYGRFRWIALALIAVVVSYLKFAAEFDMPINSILFILLFGIIYNTAYSLLLPRYRIFSRKIILSNFFTGIFNFAYITILIHFTGGVESPFILLYLLELVAVAIFGFTNLAYLLTGIASFFYLLNGMLEALIVVPHYRLSYISGTLFSNFNYLFSMTFALLLACLLLVYMTSYLAESFIGKQKQIEELSKAKVDFMNDIMHEVKSPLTSVIGYTDILLHGTFGELTKEQKSSMDVVKRQSARILEMVNNLLDIARLESGKVKIDKKPISLGAIISHVAEEMKPQLDGAKLELVQELDPNLPNTPADESKIGEVVTNLLSNAIKFSKTKGKIFVSTQVSDNHIQVSVRDEGLGIDPEDLPHIFEKFHRANKEAAAVRGTGLGLALSKTIVEAHGGRMWAVSGGRGKGAVFHLTLPAGKQGLPL